MYLRGRLMNSYKITPSSKVLFLSETSTKYPCMGYNRWKHLGKRIYADPDKMIEDGYFYGVGKNFPENGVRLEVFEKCCSMRLRSAIHNQQYSFASLVEIIVIYKIKNHLGQFCLEEEL